MLPERSYPGQQAYAGAHSQEAVLNSQQYQNQSIEPRQPTIGDSALEAVKIAETLCQRLDGMLNKIRTPVPMVVPDKDEGIPINLRHAHERLHSLLRYAHAAMDEVDANL